MDIITILDDTGIKYKKTNNPEEISIVCTSGQHEDNNPSLMYNINRDIFNCWSCGFRGGKKKFLKSIGIQTDIPFDSKQPYRIKRLKDRLLETSKRLLINLPEDYRLYNKSFRNISKKTMNDFECFVTMQQGLEDYICTPVYQFGKIKFIEGKNKFNDSESPKYLRRPSKAKVNDILFPLDKIKDKSHLIIVEGLYDMINMYDKDFSNVVCNFGSTNFSKIKLNLLEKLGTTKVTILFDGDISGVRGAERISEMLEAKYIQSKIISMPSGTDPGDMTQDQLKYVLRSLN